jgi:hypothetical protein
MPEEPTWVKSRPIIYDQGKSGACVGAASRYPGMSNAPRLRRFKPLCTVSAVMSALLPSLLGQLVWR